MSLQRPDYPIVTEPFEEEYLISAVLRNNELTGNVKNGARYKETLSKEISRLKYSLPSAFGGMFDNFSLYNHTLHPIGVLFDRVKYKTMNFIPRGNLRICVKCIMEDGSRLGSAFIHRTHVTPGTLACHIHATELLEVCPACKVEIKRHLITSLTSCISRCEAIQNTETKLDAYHYSKFIYDILKRNDSDKYRRLSMQTMNNTLEKMGYDPDSSEKYAEICEKADIAIGTGSGAYQKALKNKKVASKTPMHLFPRVAYYLYGTLDNFIAEIEIFSANNAKSLKSPDH